MGHDATHDDEHHHGIAHVASLKMLFGTFGALLVLTLLTVLATKIDLGRSLNLALAMAIATVKATLVIMFFMHLVFDKLFHTIGVLAGIFFAALFVGFILMDSGQYQDNVHWDTKDKTAIPDYPAGPKPFYLPE